MVFAFRGSTDEERRQVGRDPWAEQVVGVEHVVNLDTKLLTLGIGLQPQGPTSGLNGNLSESTLYPGCRFLRIAASPEVGGGYANLVYCPNGMNPVCDDNPVDPALDACKEVNLDGIRPR